MGARVQPGCGPARRSRRLRLSSVSPRCTRGSGEPHVRLERASPHTGSCSQQSPAAKRDPLQRPLPLGSRSVSVRPKAIRERQRRPRSRVCFFSLWVRMTSSTAQPGIFGAANPKKQQEPLLELRSTTQNSRKGFPKEEFLKDKGFLSFNCKRSSGLHHQREQRWKGSSKRSWERNGASRATSEPHPLLRAGCRC